MKFKFNNRQSGFSLVELMIVVGIIGVLATLALPRFKQFQAKAKMAEAMNVLQHVYTLQQSHSLDNTVFLSVGNYGALQGAPTGTQCTPDANAVILGFKIEPCPTTGNSPTPRFVYNVVATNAGANFTANAFTGGAANNRICPGNSQFAVSLNDSNAQTWAPGAVTGDPTRTGSPAIGTVCPN